MTREDRTEGIRYVKDIKSYSSYIPCNLLTVVNILVIIVVNS